MRFLCLLLFFSVLAKTASPAYGAAEHVGIIKSVVAVVTIERSGVSLNAEPNLKVLEGDVIQSGSTGKAGLILDDDTIISMGSNSRITIKKFMFQPNEKKLSLIAKIFHGTVSFLSGQIAKLSPNMVTIETPAATIGLRGTHVLVQVDRE